MTVLSVSASNELTTMAKDAKQTGLVNTARGGKQREEARETRMSTEQIKTHTG